MAELLTGYLREQAEKTFRYADHDCATFCIRWIDRVLGTSHVTEWLTRYSTEDECIGMVNRAGGMTAVADAFLADRGISRAPSVERGNVLLGTIGERPAFGIRISENRVAFQTIKGVAVTRPTKVIAEWGVTCLLYSQR